MATTEQKLIKQINDMPDNKQMKNMYRDAYTDLAKELEDWVDVYPTMTVSQQAEFMRRTVVAKKMLEVLQGLEVNVVDNILDVIKRVGILSFNKTYYLLEQQYRVDLGSVLMNEQKLLELANQRINHLNFSERLHNNTLEVALKAEHSITDGLVRGDSYQVIAKRLKDITNIAYNDALRISRTESGRVGALTNYEATKQIKKRGFDIKKQWVSTLDKRTRRDHAELDHQTIDVDEYFNIGRYQALHPHGFGVASEDINCRCVLINIIDGMDSDTRRDNETGETIQDMSYNEWVKDKQQ